MKKQLPKQRTLSQHAIDMIVKFPHPELIASPGRKTKHKTKQRNRVLREMAEIAKQPIVENESLTARPEAGITSTKLLKAHCKRLELKRENCIKELAAMRKQYESYLTAFNIKPENLKMLNLQHSSPSFIGYCAIKEKQLLLIHSCGLQAQQKIDLKICVTESLIKTLKFEISKDAFMKS